MTTIDYNVQDMKNAVVSIKIYFIIIKLRYNLFSKIIKLVKINKELIFYLMHSICMIIILKYQKIVIEGYDQ